MTVEARNFARAASKGRRGRRMSLVMAGQLGRGTRHQGLKIGSNFEGKFPRGRGACACDSGKKSFGCNGVNLSRALGGRDGV